MCVLCLQTVSWVIFVIFGIHSISVELKFEFLSLFVEENGNSKGTAGTMHKRDILVKHIRRVQPLSGLFSWLC